MPYYPPNTGGASYTAGTGISIAGSVISLDQSVTGAQVMSLVRGRGNSGAVSTSGTTTMTANAYATTWTDAVGAVTNVANYVIFASVSITILGTVQCNGGAGASAGTGGSSLGQGFGGAVPGAGGAGGTGVGSAGAAANSQFAGTGGSGGAGSGGAGGSGAANTVPTALRGSQTINIINVALGNATVGASALQFTGGSGGGGGGGDGTAGAGGGQGGGIVTLVAPVITIAAGAIVQANGGPGGSATAGNRGGGGGGAPGMVVMCYVTLTELGTVQTLGGAGGAGFGTGVAGSAAANTNAVVRIPVAA